MASSAFDWHPVWLSLMVASAALPPVFVAGLLTARFTTSRDFLGRSLLEAFFLLPLVLPPVATGFVLLLLCGKNGPIGRLLEHCFSTQIIFTPAAAVLASAVVAFPLMYQSAKAALLGIDRHLEDAARVLGGTRARVFWTVSLPLARPGLTAGAILSFARALGEFGATVMIAGNIPGKTTTVPLAIYFAAEGGDLRAAVIYSILIAILNLLLILLLGNWALPVARQRR